MTLISAHPMISTQMAHFICCESHNEFSSFEEKAPPSKKKVETKLFSIRENNWNSMKPNILAYKVMPYT